MSKYIYATVYEQFTGLKPPEPKSHKPRRRRGYGHPYRMRLNMQESEHEEGEEGYNDGYEEEFALESEPHDIRKPVSSPQPIYEARPSMRNAFEDNHASKLPKVTYKKRRQYESELRTE